MSQRLQCLSGFVFKALECKHCVLELYNASAIKLNDEAYVRQALVAASESANATLIDVRTHAFNPQGITGFALLAESHISIHTWPECGYAAVDVFTCGETTVPERACEFLSDTFEARSHHIVSLDRYAPELVVA